MSALLNPNHRKCSVCETYQKKIDDVEQSLLGRDAIISILQTRLKKCETNYKNLFDEFEQLRFQHCTALQDNYSLKEINTKLEEFEVKNKCNDLKGGCSHHNGNFSSHLDSNRVYQESNNPVTPEVNNIENLVSTQNEILKQLVDKIIGELKSCKCDSPHLSENLIKVQEDFKNVESGDHLDSDTKVQELLIQVESLQTVLDKCQEENECMKKLLRDRKDNLSECQHILQNSSRSINKISNSIDDLVRDKSMQKQSKENCCGLRDPSFVTLSMDDEILKNKIVHLEAEMKQKEKEYETCKCNMISQMNDISDNNQLLSDTLDIMRAENKNNLETVAKLTEELRKGNEECEQKQNEMKSKITGLENELEASYMNERKLRDSLKNTDDETKQVKEKMRLLAEENSNIKVCKCEGGFELKQKIAELECENAEMRKDNTEKTLELSEYEEENKYLSQRVECLTKCGEQMKQKLNDLEEQLYDKTKKIEKVPVAAQMSADFSYRDLEKKVSQLEEENRCLGEKCRLTGQEKLMEVDCLKKTIRIQMDEMEKLSRENAQLSNEIEGQKRENQKETDKLQAMVNHSQKQVEMLLQEHDEKTAQIQNVATELDGIRRSVTEENNNFVAKIEQLERERDELRKRLDEYERDTRTDCKCDGNRVEIEQMKSEIYKKQCIILELEKSVDNFNFAMKEFERNIEALACENTALRDDKEKQLKDFEAVQNKLAEKILEIENTQNELENTKRVCNSFDNRSALLERENQKLKKAIDGLELDQERFRRSSETEKLELQMQLHGLKEDEFNKNAALSGKLESSQKAYVDLKNKCAKMCSENEKLQEDLENCKVLIGELKNKSQNLQCACEKLKKENRESIEERYKISQKMDNAQECCDKIKRQYTSKCVENEVLKATVDEGKKENGKCALDCEGLRNKLIVNEEELLQIKEKYKQLQNNFDDKCDEFKKVKKQCESCSKQSQITREEYNNLRKEYKDIKSMLSDQIKKHRKDSNTVESSQCNQRCNSDLKKQLIEKDKQIMACQQKLKDSSYEIIELKDYIHKLISDNNILKSAINNLIGNLERKIKGPNARSLCTNSADAIAGEILQSLTTIENTIIKKSQNTFCSQGCTNKECDCMSQIQSQYVKEPEPEQGTSKAGRKEPSCAQHCFAKLSRDWTEPTSANHCDTNMSSLPSTNVFSDPSSTTDSEDYHGTSFLDKRSVEFLKEAIEGLKTSKDNTMKEKSCDCERS